MTYDLGYFEGIRNAFMAYASVHDDESLGRFKEWLIAELEEAKALKEESS